MVSKKKGIQRREGPQIVTVVTKSQSERAWFDLGQSSDP